MKKIFLSFADSRYLGSRQRIKKQARRMGVYDEIICLDERDLGHGFRHKFKDQLVLGSRGYGYWAWKPQIVLQALNNCDDGDIVQYTDAGCHLNPKGRDRLLEYFDSADQSPSGILAFSYGIPSTLLNQDRENSADWPNRHWTKGDLLDYLNVRDNAKILNSQTMWAGAVFFKKQPESIAFLREWLAVIEHDFRLIDDTPSVSPNPPGFIEHRHDQAIFSVLCQLHEITCLSAYEQYNPSKDPTKPDWESLGNFPIHARRDKEIGILNRIRSRLLRILCLLKSKAGLRP